MPRLPKFFVLTSAAAGAVAAGAKLLRRGGGAAPTPSPAPAPPAESAATATPAPPAESGATAPPVSVATASPPPVETPGPSVTPPAYPGSETEREEAADALAPDPELLADRAGGPVDDLVERETAAAAAEAAGIGGPLPEGEEQLDPEMRAVYEAGGGEAEGFEQAEADLIENASHGSTGANPLRDAFTPEVESDVATAAYGEADEEKVNEVVADPEADPDEDPGTGPGLTHER